jgi:molecular chaperone HtpG
MADVLAKYSAVTEDKCKKSDHFFEVSMLGISDASTQFLDPAALETYLSVTAPVDFDPHDFVYAPAIQQWVKRNGVTLPTVSLTIAAPSMRREVFKPYRNSYKTSHQRSGQFDVEIRNVAFYPEELDEDARFWIWYGVSDLPGTIDDLVAGFRLRKNNISLGGPDGMVALFQEVSPSYGRFNAYHIGEVHVLCPDAIPNARRDGFENTGSWPRICSEILPFVRERCGTAYKASSTRNLPAQKVKASAEKALLKAETSTSIGIASRDERDKLLSEVRKTREKVDQWVESRKKSNEAKQVQRIAKRLEEVETKLQDEKNFVAKKTRTSLDRKQRNLLQDVVSIIYTTLESRSCKRAAECAEEVRKAISRKYGKS